MSLDDKISNIQTLARLLESEGYSEDFNNFIKVKENLSNFTESDKISNILDDLIDYRRTYGYTDEGEKIIAPEGWELIEERGEIPQIHREFIGKNWCFPRRCHSTMTPMDACVWGSVKCFARKTDEV